MKSLDFESMGVQEINQQELVEVNGGWIWIPIAIGLWLIAQNAY